MDGSVAFLLMRAGIIYGTNIVGEILREADEDTVMSMLKLELKEWRGEKFILPSH